MAFKMKSGSPMKRNFGVGSSPMKDTKPGGPMENHNRTHHLDDLKKFKKDTGEVEKAPTEMKSPMKHEGKVKSIDTGPPDYNITGYSHVNEDGGVDTAENIHGLHEGAIPHSESVKDDDSMSQGYNPRTKKPIKMRSALKHTRYKKIKSERGKMKQKVIVDPDHDAREKHGEEPNIVSAKTKSPGKQTETGKKIIKGVKNLPSKILTIVKDLKNKITNAPTEKEKKEFRDQMNKIIKESQVGAGKK